MNDFYIAELKIPKIKITSKTKPTKIQFFKAAIEFLYRLSLNETKSVCSECKIIIKKSTRKKK